MKISETEISPDEDVLASCSSAEIYSFAQRCLIDCFGRQKMEESLSTHGLFEHSPLERVNVTIRTHGHLRGSMSAEGESLGSQIRSAVANSARDRRFGSRLSAVELDAVTMEIWLQIRSQRVPAAEIEHGHFLELGVHGVEIRLGSKSAYYKPSVAITSGRRTIESLMSGLSRKAGLAHDAWKYPEAVVVRTEWLSISSCNANIAPSPQAAGKSRVKKLDILRWLRESAYYLINSQQASGDFTYIYDPIEDREVIEPSNRVRSAGCLYALSRFYDSSHFDSADTAFEAALRAMVIAQIERTLDWSDGGRIMPEAKSSALPKLGSTALLALALGGSKLSQQFPAAYDGFFKSVSLAQLPSGRFRTHFGSDFEHVRSSEFFSGQALLVFIQRAERGDTTVVKKCSAAFDAYRLQYLANPSSAFVGWHVDVWSRLALLTHRCEYAEFAFQQTDWLLNMQIEAAPEASWVGGFSAGDHMPKFSSIVFLEAVAKAYILATTLGETRRIERYRRALQLGISFCERLRLGEAQMKWFPNPQRSRGGVALSLLDRRVRCDVPQHLVTLCLTLLQANDLLS